ncbi:hypothetical protein KAFR_0A07390 [Kazachstania africana CBS 2517]|uniref:Uncharacterized protein n=1 Tax=Kazachstania africana (strain ATCC 22294 / BCRC 22015 / CBS 2517 / CECT 1963 / NBRC 1671 / NRRL Y-8276) TaxID=1071382 RepID=H2AP73_KAZAF|nr:hypothetical protein KAFR_0A07390 [Kazachstania africana CBS 2517]CCF56173.1 hypothetical protein KAFR_0A07390 [Kazachstania africana CBS 2517]
MAKDTKEDAKIVVKKEEGETTNDSTTCPNCGQILQKCLIQQNYAIVICPSERCSYPFDQNEVLDQLSYVDETEVLDAAQQRLSGS